MSDLLSTSSKAAFAGLSISLPIVIALGGCRGLKSVDFFPVSSPPNETTSAHRSFAQSETAMVRIDQTADRPEGEPLARYLVGYNDDTLAIADVASTCFTFTPTQPTLDGWARSDDFGGNWVRQQQLPVSAALRRRGVGARHGDPWLAAWSSKGPEVPGVVLYASVTQRGPGRLDGPFFLLLTRSRDHGKNVTPPSLLTAASTMVRARISSVPAAPAGSIPRPANAAAARVPPAGRASSAATCRPAAWSPA